MLLLQSALGEQLLVQKCSIKNGTWNRTFAGIRIKADLCSIKLCVSQPQSLPPQSASLEEKTPVCCSTFSKRVACSDRKKKALTEKLLVKTEKQVCLENKAQQISALKAGKIQVTAAELASLQLQFDVSQPDTQAMLGI